MTGLGRKLEHRPRHAGRTPCGNGVRDWSDAAPKPRGTRDCQQPPEAGKIKDGASPRPAEKARPCSDTLISDFGLQNHERINSYCFKSLQFLIICYRNLRKATYLSTAAVLTYTVLYF